MRWTLRVRAYGQAGGHRDALHLVWWRVMARDALGLSFGDVDILSAIRKLLERQRATPAKENAS